MTLSILCGSTVEAAELLTDLGVEQAVLQADAGASAASSVTGDGILGGERDLRLEITGAGGATAAVVDSVLRLETAPGAAATLRAVWDGEDGDPETLDPAGLGGLDLTAGGDHVRLQLLVAGRAAFAELFLEIYTDGESSSRAKRRIVPGPTPVDFHFPFDRFVVDRGDGADLTNVGAVVLTIVAEEGPLEVGRLVATGAEGLGGPTVGATLTDSLAVDVDMDGAADPGDTIEYTGVITVADDVASGVGFDRAGDPNANTAFVMGSLDTTPLAFDDSASATGNVSISVAAASGLLANDVEADGTGGLNVSAFDAMSLAGGDVTVAADGGYTYAPPPGFEGADSFTYTIEDGETNLDTATVSLTVSDVVWFIDNSVASGGDGTLGDPYDTIAAFNSGAADETDDVIFVAESGQGSYVAGLTLLNGQALLGQGVDLTTELASLGITLAADSDAVPGMGSRPVFTTTAADAITVAQSNTIKGLDVANTGAFAGIAGASVGTLTVGSVAMTGSGDLVDLNGGTLAVTFDSLATTSSVGGAAIDLNGVGGSFTVSNPGAGLDTSIASAVRGIEVTSSPGAMLSFGETSITGASGINVVTNVGATASFDSLAIVTTAGIGLFANNAGTANVAGSTNTVNAIGGAAVDVNQTGLGGAGWTFSSVSSANGVFGISLVDVTGAFTANGGAITGASGSAFRVDGGGFNVTYAGTINNTSNRAVEVRDRAGGAVQLTGNITHNAANATGLEVTNNSSGATTVGGSSVAVNSGTATAVSLTNNTGHTIDFTNGGLDIDTTSGSGFSATGGGTVTAQGSNNTATSGTGTAVNVDGTTIGASGLTFRSVTANGATSGIVLNNTGSSGGLTVTGDGSNSRNASGGTIQNTVSHAVALTNTQNFSATSLDVMNPGTAFGDQHGVSATNLRGSNNLVRAARFSSVSDTTGDAIRVRNTNTNLGRFEVVDSLFTGVNGGGNDGVLFDMKGTSVGRLDVTTNCHFDGLRGDGVQVLADDDSTVTANILNSRFSNDSGIQPGGIGGASASRLSLRAADGSFPQTSGGTLTATVSSNVFDDAGVQSGGLPVGLIGVIDVLGDQFGSVTTTISSNTIQDIEEDGAIRLIFDDNSSGIHLVDANTVSSVNEPAVFFQARDFAGATHLTVRNNNFGAGPNGAPGGGDDLPVGTENANFHEDTIRVFVEESAATSHVKVVGNDIVNSSSSQGLDADCEDSAVLNLTVHNNRMTNVGANGEAFDIEADNGGQLCLDLNGDNLGGNRNTLQQGGGFPEADGVIDLMNDGGTFQIEDLTGGTNAAAVDAFLTPRNDFSSNLSVEDGGLAFSSVSECTEPTLPP